MIRLRTGSRETLLEGHDDDVNSVSFSPDGRLLVSAGRDHDVIVWDVAGGRRRSGSTRRSRRRSRTHGSAPTVGGSSPPVRSPRSSLDRGGRARSYLYGPRSPPTAVAFEPDSRGVVSVEQDGDVEVVRRWSCELCGAARRADALARAPAPRDRTGSLSDDERARYLR